MQKKKIRFDLSLIIVKFCLEILNIHPWKLINQKNHYKRKIIFQIKSEISFSSKGTTDHIFDLI